LPQVEPAIVDVPSRVHKWVLRYKQVNHKETPKTQENPRVFFCRKESKKNKKEKTLLPNFFTFFASLTAKAAF